MPAMDMPVGEHNPFSLYKSEADYKQATLEGLAIIEQLLIQLALWQAKYAHVGADGMSAKDEFLKTLRRRANGDF